MKVVTTKIGGRRGFHSMTMQYLGFTLELKEDERLVLDLYGNENAYQDNLTNKNTWGQWFVQEDWTEDEVVREVGSIHHGSSIGAWLRDVDRFVYHLIMKKHLVVRDHILEKVKTFKATYFGDSKVLGVHIRGNEIFSDNTRPKLSFNYYKHKIDLYLEKEHFDKILVCSDQIHTINKLKNIYGEKIITYPSLPYSSNGSHDFVYSKITPNEGYIRGEDVLVESILLAETTFLLKPLSGMTNFSLIYNPELQYCDIDFPFYDIKDYSSGKPPFLEHICKYEDDFSIFREEIKNFEDTLPTIQAIDRVAFIQSYL